MFDLNDSICDFDLLAKVKWLKCVIIKMSNDLNYLEDIIKLKQNSKVKLIFEVYFKDDWLFDKELLNLYEKQFEETK